LALVLFAISIIVQRLELAIMSFLMFVFCVIALFYWINAASALGRVAEREEERGN
jgi:hypothetical protein